MGTGVAAVASNIALMPSRAIFADIDGVLNHSKTKERYRHQSRPGGAVMGIDPANVAVFNQLLSEVPLGVVITSSWRWTHTLEELRAIFSKAGIRGEVLGKIGVQYPGSRWKDIQAWINENGPIASFVIFDDGEDMGPLASRLVRTAPETGLREKHVSLALKLLNTQVITDNHPF